MKKILLLSLFLGLCGLSLHAATVAHYEFNGTGTATVGSTVTDVTGNHNGTVQGGDLVYGSDPLVGGYLSFDLDGADRVVVSGAAGLLFDVNQSYTVEVIFRTTMTSDIGSLISKGADVSNPDSQLWIRYQGNGQLRGLIEGVDNTTEDSATSSAATPVNNGQWHRVALVFDGAASPKKLQIYVDGNLSGSDASVGTLGVIGGTDTDPLVIGEFASLALNRSFVGDISAIRLSDTALAPQDFLQVAATYITSITPTNKASFLSASTVASFVVKSPTIGVAATNIHAWLNNVDVSSQLSFAGTDADRTVTLPALSANQFYQMTMTATDYASNQISETITFNTFSTGLVFLEGEDYNFDGGQFIDNPQLSSVPGPNNYLDRFGQEGIDFHQTNTPTLTQYRIGDQVGTAVGQDALRQAYIDAQVTDPGVADYVARDNANSEWLNYTRTFPADTYRVYARVARGGSVPIVMRLDEVTSGSTTASQTLSPVGGFLGQPTGSTADYDFIPLTDALGNEIAVALNGVTTLRLTMVSGTASLNLNYLVFVPASTVQVPFLAAISPVAGAGNEPNNTPILATIRNADTSVNTGSVQLKVDGASVTPVVTGTSLGAEVSYSPSLLATGTHTITLIFSDSAATSVTNIWQFHVANLAVRGYWMFNEQTPGNFASTNSGAILDLSGNTRHGTANSAAMPYVTGSFNYGNSPALQFSSGTDHVVVPDAAGNFTFTGSFTFEAVVRTTSSSTTAAILAKNGTGDGEGEYWWRLPGAANGTQRIGLNGQLFLGGTNAVNDGQWHHLAVVYDQSLNEVRLYADYAQEAAATFTMDRPIGRPVDLHVGSFVGGGSEFEGDIDLIRVSDGALAPAQFVQTTVALQPIVKSLRPVSGANNVAPQALIEAEFQNRDTSVVLSSLKLFIDGSDVTSSATKTTDGTTAKISYTPSVALTNGLHTARTTFNDTAVPANSWTNTWSFSVASVVPVLGFYQLNEKIPGSTADTITNAILDVSGNGRHATASGALPYVAGSPNHGNSSALQFIVGGGYLMVPDAAGNFNWPATQSVTLEALVRTVNIGENSVGSILAKQGATPGEWWWRINATGRQQFLINNGVNGAKSVNGAAVLNDGQWHHLAAVYDATAQQVRVYVDYALDGSAAAVNAAPGNIGNAKDVWIGAFQNLDREFDGEMDSVRISALALDPSWFIPLGGLASPVQLLNARTSSGNIAFDFVTETGRTYVVQTNIALGLSWGDAQTIPGDGTLKTASFPVTGTQKNFRVKTQ
jgi:hypothetical protein